MKYILVFPEDANIENVEFMENPQLHKNDVIIKNGREFYVQNAVVLLDEGKFLIKLIEY